jgi:hypothetical protein
MTSLPNSHIISTREIFVELLATPFRAFGNAMIAMVERNPRAIAIARLNEISDEELAAKGLTRADAVRQILGVHL